MAKIYKSDVIQKAVSDLGLQAATDKVPSETLDKVQLTYNLNKNFSSFVSNNTSTATGASNITWPTVSTGGEIYMTALTASFAKDATCDIADGQIKLNLTPSDSNTSVTILGFANLTLTADAQTATLSFPYPLKIKTGTTIGWSPSFTVGKLTRSISVMGFITSSL